MSEQFLVYFIKRHFDGAFENIKTQQSKLFLQDGDVGQKSKRTKKALSHIGARQFRISPRSLDINTIDNFVHLIKNKLYTSAPENIVTKETYEEIPERLNVQKK